VLGRDELVKNMTSWHQRLVAKVVTQIEIIQSKVVASARKGHGRGAHSKGRFETDTGALEESIQPGKIYLTDNTVRGVIEARTEYASFVEKLYPYIAPAVMEHSAEFRSRLRKVAGEK
jgi:hypothetical protein